MFQWRSHAIKFFTNDSNGFVQNIFIEQIDSSGIKIYEPNFVFSINICYKCVCVMPQKYFASFFDVVLHVDSFLSYCRSFDEKKNTNIHKLKHFLLFVTRTTSHDMAFDKMQSMFGVRSKKKWQRAKQAVKNSNVL